MNSNSGQLQLSANDALVAQTAQMGVFRAHLTPDKSAYDARSRHPPQSLFWQYPQPVAIWNAGGNARVAIHAATICINSLQNPTAQYQLAGGAPSGDCFDPANLLAEDSRANGTALRPPPASESARRAPTRADARLPAGPDGTNCFDCTQQFNAATKAGLAGFMIRDYVRDPYDERPGMFNGGRHRPSAPGGHELPEQFAGRALMDPPAATLAQRQAQEWPGDGHQYYLELNAYNAPLNQLFARCLGVLAPGDADRPMLRACALGFIMYDGRTFRSARTVGGTPTVQIGLERGNRDFGVASIGADVIDAYLASGVAPLPLTMNLAGLPYGNAGSIVTDARSRGAAGLPDMKHDAYNIMATRGNAVTDTHNATPPSSRSTVDLYEDSRGWFDTATGVFTPTLRHGTQAEFMETPKKNLEYIRQRLWAAWTDEQKSVFLNAAHLDDGGLHHSGGILVGVYACWSDLWSGRRLARPAALAEANTVADAFLNTPLFGAPLSGAPAAAGPRFKAYVEQKATGDVLMTDTALFVAATATSPAIPAHPGTVTIKIEMRCDDADTSGLAAADHALFAERVVRFFDYIGPCVAPAKMHRWTVGFGWSDQRS